MINPIKKPLLKMIWPYGSTPVIKRGPLKGYKFTVTPNSGWSPLVGRWEPEAQQLFSRIIKKGDVVYDLGANNGIHSMLFASRVGQEGSVYAFEPLQSNCKEISNNAALNNIGNLQVVNAAVGGTDKEVIFHLGLHDKQGSVVGIGRESGKDVKVKMLTLDNFIEQGNRKPDFIKMDIEGAEGMALEGFEKHIDSTKPIFYIELHSPEQDAMVGKYLLRHEYIAFRILDGIDQKQRPKLERIADLTKPYPNPDGIWGNILALHPDKLNFLKQQIQ